MPGIAGIISKRPAADCKLQVASMVQRMNHEPIYLTGTHAAPELGIYVGWVAIEGSFAAQQVFRNELGDVELVLAGECFLDPEIGRELKRKGHGIGPDSASWLVHLYEEQGDRFFERLNGLFSGLLIDKRSRQIFLFNDRFGFERLCFVETKDSFYFASEAKALLRVLPELRAFDLDGVSEYLAFGCTLGGRTLFRGIGQLPGGSAWTFNDAGCRKTQYFSPVSWEQQTPLDEKSFDDEFEAIFNRVLPRYYQSPPPVGIALTGGLDTRMVLASRPKNIPGPACYTFAGPVGETRDVCLAAKVAAACGLNHQILRIGPDFFSDFAALSDRTVYITDGSFGSLGAHEIYFNHLARSIAPIRLTGVFGSEVLRGMSTFKQQNLAPELFSSAMQDRMAASIAQASLGSGHPVTFAAFKEIPWNIGGSLAACRSQITFRTPYLDNEIVALAYRAPESIRKRPSSAIRLIGRNDPALSKIPTDRALLGTSSPLARRFNRFTSEVTFKLDYYYNEGMPHSVSRFDGFLSGLNSKVRLFGQHKYLNYRRWFRSELSSYLASTLMDPSIQESPFWNRDTVTKLASDHIEGRKNRTREINAVLTLHAVNRLLIQSAQ